MSRGARLLSGGTAINRAGWFYEPTLLVVGDVRDEFVLNETFGPAAAVIVADSVDEAIEIANGTEYGLVGAVFTRDRRAATYVSNSLAVGMVKVNGPTTGADYWVPFGGSRASSFGPREQGRAARDFYTSTRTVTTFS
jgi:aldehyde dehydrogenase (NAD+)